MKKIILTSAIIFGAVAAAFAQVTEPTASAQTTLNVNLKPLQTIEVNNSEVNLTYTTKDDYKNGVTSVENNHLTIYSTGGFQVFVKANAEGTMKTGEKEMETSKITVTASKGTDNALGGSAFAGAVKLTNGDLALFSNDIGGVNRNFDVTYNGAGGDAFVNNYIETESGGPTVYTTTVTYSIVAQ